MLKKKFSVAAAVLVFFLSAVFGEEAVNDTVTSLSFFEPVVQKGIASSETEISDFVRTQIEYFVTTYSSITVDSSNNKELIDYQKTHSSIEAGKMDFASFVTESTISKLGEEYSLSIKVDNAKLGTIRAIANTHFAKNVLTSNELLTNEIGSVMSDILLQLDVKLTQYQINCMKGNAAINDASSAELQQMIDSSKSEIALLDAKLAALNTVKDDSSKKEAIKVQAMHDKLVLKQQSNERRLAQKIEDEKKAAEELEKSAQRTDEINKTIQKQKIEYQKKAAELRKANLKSMNTEDQIAAIEQNKQFIINIREECSTNKLNFASKTDLNAQTDIEEINAAPYRQAEKDKEGNPIAEAVELRHKKIIQIKLKAANDIKAYNASQDKIESDTETKLMKEISDNYSILKTKQTVSSLDDSSLLRINNYDGNLHSWSSEINLWINGTVAADYEIFVPYEALTGKKVDNSDQDYLDTVEEFDSYFRSNIPIVYAVVEYTVEPDSVDNPSNYIVHISRTTLYNIETQKKIASNSQSNLTGTFASAPALDIRTQEQKDRYVAEVQKNLSDEQARQYKEEQKEAKRLEKEDEENERALEEENTKAEKEQRQKEFAEKSKVFLSPAKHCGAEAGLKFAKSPNDDQRKGYFASIDLPSQKVFFGFEATAWNVKYDEATTTTSKDAYGNNVKETTNGKFNFDSAVFDIGGRIGMHFTWFKKLLSPYMAIGGGYEFSHDFKPQMYYFQGTAGFHVFYIFDVCYNCKYDENHDLNHSIGISLAINGPWF